MGKLRVIIAILSVVVVFTRGALADRNVIHADLAFHFVCEDKNRSALEDDIDKFLRQQGFKVLNQGRIQREHAIFLFDLIMIGLDDRRRTIDVTAVPTTQGRYAVTLRTPPPTERAPQLEDALLAFASKTLGCQVRQVTRSENASDATDFYNREIRRIESLFWQAEQLRGARRL